MSFKDLIDHRHSCRQFTDEPVISSETEKILYATGTAPSAGNLQAYEIAVIQDPDARKKIADAAFANVPKSGHAFLNTTPLILVFLADSATSAEKYGPRGILYATQDATIACTYAQLAAQDLGLGSVWIGAFSEKMVGEALELPLNLSAVAMLAIGHPASKLLTSPSKSVKVFGK